MAKARKPTQRLAQGDANQVKAPTTAPKGHRRPGIATVANQAQAGTVPSTRRGPLAPAGGELARAGRDQSPTPGEKAALAALHAQGIG